MQSSLSFRFPANAGHAFIWNYLTRSSQYYACALLTCDTTNCTRWCVSRFDACRICACDQFRNKTRIPLLQLFQNHVDVTIIKYGSFHVRASLLRATILILFSFHILSLFYRIHYKCGDIPKSISVTCKRKRKLRWGWDNSHRTYSGIHHETHSSLPIYFKTAFLLISPNW